MLANIVDILRSEAPDLFARTQLPRTSSEYVTQRKAFEIHRQRKLENLGKFAPDLFARTQLPIGDPERLETHRAYQLFRGHQAKVEP